MSLFGSLVDPLDVYDGTPEVKPARRPRRGWLEYVLIGALVVLVMLYVTSLLEPPPRIPPVEPEPEVFYMDHGGFPDAGFDCDPPREAPEAPAAPAPAAPAPPASAVPAAPARREVPRAFPAASTERVRGAGAGLDPNLVWRTGQRYAAAFALEAGWDRARLAAAEGEARAGLQAGFGALLGRGAPAVMVMNERLRVTVDGVPVRANLAYGVVLPGAPSRRLVQYGWWLLEGRAEPLAWWTTEPVGLALAGEMRLRLHVAGTALTGRLTLTPSPQSLAGDVDAALSLDRER